MMRISNGTAASRMMRFCFYTLVFAFAFGSSAASASEISVSTSLGGKIGMDSSDFVTYNENTEQITTWAQLAAGMSEASSFAENLKNDSNLVISLNQDLNVSSQLTYLRGTLDGNNHTITFKPLPELDIRGLIAGTDGARINDLDLDVEITSRGVGVYGPVAGLINDARNTIIDGLTGTVKVTSGEELTAVLGGIVGFGKNVTLTDSDLEIVLVNSSSSASTSAPSMGSVFGQADDSKIEKSKFEIEVVNDVFPFYVGTFVPGPRHNSIGGLIGDALNGTEIKTVEVNGDVTNKGTGYTGGLIGRSLGFATSDSSYIELLGLATPDRSSAERILIQDVKIKSLNVAAGRSDLFSVTPLTESLSYNSFPVGGIVGTATDTTLKNVFTDNAISVTSDSGSGRVGGLIGHAYLNNVISDSPRLKINVNNESLVSGIEIGGLVAESSGLSMRNLTNLEISVKSSRSSILGGLIAMANGLSYSDFIENIGYNSITIQDNSGNLDSATIGGLVGQAANATINNIYQMARGSGSIRVNSRSLGSTGGLIGNSQDSRIGNVRDLTVLVKNSTFSEWSKNETLIGSSYIYGNTEIKNLSNIVSFISANDLSKIEFIGTTLDTPKFINSQLGNLITLVVADDNLNDVANIVKITASLTETQYIERVKNDVMLLNLQGEPLVTYKLFVVLPDGSSEAIGDLSFDADGNAVIPPMSFNVEGDYALTWGLPISSSESSEKSEEISIDVVGSLIISVK